MLSTQDMWYISLPLQGRNSQEFPGAHLAAWGGPHSLVRAAGRQGIHSKQELRGQSLLTTCHIPIFQCGEAWRPAMGREKGNRSPKITENTNSAIWHLGSVYTEARASWEAEMTRTFSLS